MANEAVIKQRLADPIDFTVADSSAFLKGSILALVDPKTVSGVVTTTSRIAGIAARDKVASDGRTQIAVFRRGIFDMKASGAILIGSSVTGAPDNFVRQAGGAASGAMVLGSALETASDGEVIEVELNIGAGGVQG